MTKINRDTKKSDLEREILNIFHKEPRKVFNYKQISKRLHVNDHGLKVLLSRLMDELTHQGLLLQEGKGRYKLKDVKVFIEGKIQIARSGSAFVISEETEVDTFIPPSKTGGAFDGDTVKVSISSFSRGKRPEGTIVEILQRSKTEFTGIIDKSLKYAFLIPIDKRSSTDIFIPLSKLNGAEDGQVALARVTEWPEDTSSNPVGEIIEVFGKRGENDTEICSILAEFGLPRGFPQALEEEAKLIPTDIPETEIKKRKDFRKTTTFTIDPVDAKDFDDALSIKKLENGNYEVGVHIADVTHYVKPNTKIEQEAKLRATSIYLVDRVIPMLPEILSNHVCSLRPHEEKLCYAAVFEMNESGELKSDWFGRTVILSDHRFTYEEVQDILETGEVLHNATPHLKDCLITLNDIAKVLRNKRMRNGALSFDRAEVKFTLNEKAEPTGVYFKEQKDAHKLIEEFMLLANRKVAELVGKANTKTGKKTPPPFVYRVHDSPPLEKLNNFSLFIKRFGYTINTGSGKETARSLNKLLSEVKGKKEANVIETLAVRSMSKALYTTDNAGHYGLAFDYYTHFTSPIRRYPDMMVHRLLDDFLNDKKPSNKEELEKGCKHSSQMELLASEAERASIKFKQVQFLEDKIGMEFKGLISGVTEWGIFVELEENKCEGLIRLSDIQGDFYEYDEKNYRVIGRRRKKAYQLGDEIMVRVKRADLEKKQLDFEILMRIKG